MWTEKLISANRRKSLPDDVYFVTNVLTGIWSEPTVLKGQLKP